MIILSWPEEIDVGEVRDLLASYSWLNPHAIFRFNDEPASSVGTEVAKWPAGAPTPPHWYTPERFVHRVLLEIKRDPALTVAQFLDSVPRAQQQHQALGRSRPTPGCPTSR